MEATLELRCATYVRIQMCILRIQACTWMLCSRQARPAATNSVARVHACTLAAVIAMLTKLKPRNHAHQC